MIVCHEEQDTVVAARNEVCRIPVKRPMGTKMMRTMRGRTKISLMSRSSHVRHKTDQFTCIRQLTKSHILIVFATLHENHN